MEVALLVVGPRS
uniref:Uncharacterized protein n=1 Tax=Rhizophora mucronata TaxID=61149 RepID=A0A2P2NTP0_RHIMU